MFGGRTTAAWPARLARLGLVAVAYYVSARLGLRLALVDDIVTPLWPPTGVAIVALAAFGFGVWPAVALAAFAVNVSLADTPLVAGSIAMGNTLAPVVGAALLRRFAFSPTLAHLRDAVVLVAVALASMTVSATIGTAAIALSNASVDVVDTWWVWWAGDAMGVLIVAPLLWALADVRPGRPDGRRAAEACILFAALGVVAVFASRADDGFLFIILPLVGWIAWRFQQRGAAPAGLLVSTIVILAAADNAGIFRDVPVLRSMVVLQAFNASVALTSFVFAAAVTERRRMLEALYDREHHIAETLQRSLLPDLPSIAGIDIAARYFPSTLESEVGGDWYDVIPLPDDRIGVVVGDVVGHGISAAATMAELRMGLRAYALRGGGPAATVGELNRMVNELYPGTMATLLYAELDRENRELRLVNAGHPSPILVSPSGSATYLEDGRAMPIGVAAQLDCREAVHRLLDDATLVLFTDGLVERRDVSMEENLERLRLVCAAEMINPDRLCDRITTSFGIADAIDDVALLVLRPVALASEVHGPGTGASHRTDR